MQKSKLDEYDSNLLVVAAVDGFAHRYNLSAAKAYKTFLSYSIPKLIRENYESLHTQDLIETVNFADDIIKRNAI